MCKVSAKQGQGFRPSAPMEVVRAQTNGHGQRASKERLGNTAHGSKWKYWGTRHKDQKGWIAGGARSASRSYVDWVPAEPRPCKSERQGRHPSTKAGRIAETNIHWRDNSSTIASAAPIPAAARPASSSAQIIELAVGVVAALQERRRQD